ncbi:MAG: anti-sigma F factor [Thermoflexaceae bacterium]|nr:anti-sigma F factor [Thermoflexaceae bacterium]
MKDRMKLEFDSKSSNESFARVTVASFVVRLDPTLEEMSDIKTAVSEAVTNCVVHGYENGEGIITIECYIEENEITVIVEDKGVGIADVEKAMEPLYTTKPNEERAGMGFSFMEIFMDELLVESCPGQGTKVTMKKKIEKK